MRSGVGKQMISSCMSCPSSMCMDCSLHCMVPCTQAATTLLMRDFDARKTLQTLVDRRCTVFMAVPTIHNRLLDVPDAKSFDLSHVRLITSGSDRLPDEVFTGFQQTFGHTLLERYGMTETGMNCSNPLHGERRIGSVGLPLPGVGSVASSIRKQKRFFQMERLGMCNCADRTSSKDIGDSQTRHPLHSPPTVGSRLVIWDSAKRMVTSPYAAAPRI